MAYSETRIVIGGLAHVPVLIFIANFIKGKFGIKTEETKDTVVKGEPVKIIEVKDILVKEGKAEAFIASAFPSLTTVSFTSIILTSSPLTTVSFVSSVLIPNLPFIKLAIKIRIGTWARPPITILVSE